MKETVRAKLRVLVRRILRKYVNLLDVSGKLSEKPLRNHLSTNQETLDL